MKEYVSLTFAVMKMGERQFCKGSYQRFLRGKNASLGNSIINHPGHVTLTSWIFYIEIWKS